MSTSRFRTLSRAFAVVIAATATACVEAPTETATTSACTQAACMNAVCGDGLVTGDEQCERPGTAGCDATCRRVATCGDGHVDAPETCDDGNTDPQDGCAADCRAFESPLGLAISFVSPLPDAVAGTTVEIEVHAASSAGVTSLAVRAPTGLADLDPRPEVFRADLTTAGRAPGVLTLVADAADAAGLRAMATRRIHLPATVAAGAPVEASAPTELRFPNGAAIRWPAFSMDPLASVDLEPLARDEAPLPVPGEVLVGAVRASPSGTTFSPPATLRFPIFGSLPPGAGVPLLLYDEAARRWNATGTLARVTSDGRHLEAAVTHFSTYAASLPVGAIPGTIEVSLDPPERTDPPGDPGACEASVVAPGEPVVIERPAVRSAVGVDTRFDPGSLVVRDGGGANLTGLYGSAITDAIATGAVTTRGGQIGFTAPAAGRPVRIELEVGAGNGLGEVVDARCVDVCAAGPRPIFLVPGVKSAGEQWIGEALEEAGMLLYADAGPFRVWETLRTLDRPLFLIDLPNPDLFDPKPLLRSPDTTGDGLGEVQGWFRTTSEAAAGPFAEGFLTIPAQDGLSPAYYLGAADIVMGGVSLAHQIQAVLDELDARNGGDYFGCAAREVDIVATSLGGMSSRYLTQYLQQHADFRVKNFVTISAPLRGVSTAAMTVGHFSAGLVASQEMWGDNPLGRGQAFSDALVQNNVGCQQAVPPGANVLESRILQTLNAIACTAAQGVDLTPLGIPFAFDPLGALVDALFDQLRVPSVIPLLQQTRVPANTRLTTIAGVRFDAGEFGADTPSPTQIVGALDLLASHDFEPPDTRIPWDMTINVESSSSGATEGEAFHAEESGLVHYTLHANGFTPFIVNRWEEHVQVCVDAGAYSFCDLDAVALDCALAELLPGLNDAERAMLIAELTPLLDASGAVCEQLLAATVAVANQAIDVINATITASPVDTRELLPPLSPYFFLPKIAFRSYRPVWSSCDATNRVTRALRLASGGSDDENCDFVLNNEEIARRTANAVTGGVGALAGGQVVRADESTPDTGGSGSAVTTAQWHELLTTCLFPNPEDPYGNHDRIAAYVANRVACGGGGGNVFTTAIGFVELGELTIPDAVVTCAPLSAPQLSAVGLTDAVGAFRIADVAADRGDIECTAEAIGRVASSGPVTPIPNGITDMDFISLP